MKKIGLLFIMALLSAYTCAQVGSRINVSGKVIADGSDLEGISVYNTTAKHWTSTDEYGTFKISVAVNDTIQFGALRYKDFSIVIDQSIIDSKQMTVFLVEHVNILEEVVILPYDLSGNLTIDVEAARTFVPDMEAIDYGIKHSDEYQFTDDYKSRVKEMTVHSQAQTMQYGLNVGNLVGLLLKPLFKNSKIKERKTSITPLNSVKARYSAQFLYENFGVPLDEMDAFVTYVEDDGLDANLLKIGNEMLLLEVINQKSKLFLQQQGAKH